MHDAGMTEFLAALAVFLCSHSIPAMPQVRAGLVRLFGERLYLAVYAATSLLILAWLIGAARRAPFVPLWDVSASAYWAPLLAMPAAIFLLVSGLLAVNPLSVALRSKAFDVRAPGIVGITRHPVLWAFAIWSAAHMVPNGDLVSAILFGGFMVFALAAMPTIDRRKSRQLGMGWQRLASATSALPFAATLAGRGLPAWPRGQLLLATAITITAYLALLLAHAAMFGPDPTAVLR